MQLDWTRPSWSNGCGLCLTCMSLSQTVHSIHSSSCKKFQATLSLAERKARHCHVAGRKMYRQCPPKIWACFGAHLRKGETIMFAMAHICRHVFQRILSTKLPCGFERVAGKKNRAEWEAERPRLLPNLFVASSLKLRRFGRSKNPRMDIPIARLKSRLLPDASPP